MRRAALVWRGCGGDSCGWLRCGVGAGCGAVSEARCRTSHDARRCEALRGSAANGGRLHGVVKSGNIPLPGVTVTAQNTLTGKKYSTTTDITGAWSMTLPQNGRYVIRTRVCGVCGWVAGSAAERDEPRPDGEFRFDAGFARGRSRSSEASQAAN